MQLTILTEPTEEMITPAEVKKYLCLDHDDDDTLISQLITTTRNALESMVQKTILPTTLQYEIMGKSIRHVLSPGNYLYPHTDGASIIVPLPKPPVIELERVELFRNGSFIREMESKNCKLERENSQFFVKIYGFRNRLSYYRFRIIYRAGMGSSENIPHALKLANLLLTAHAYRNRFRYDSADFMPTSVRQLLTPFLTWRLL